MLWIINLSAFSIADQGSLIISSWFSYKYWLSFLKLKGKLRYNKLQKQKDDTFEKLKIQHKKLKEFVRKSYQK